MKILVISSIFRPYRRGGAEVLVQSIVDELVRVGHDVVVLTAGEWKGFSSLWPQSEKQGDLLTIYRWYPLNIFSLVRIAEHSFPERIVWHLFDIVNIHTYLVVRLLLRRERPDLVLAHNVKGLGYLVPHAIHQGGVRYIQTMHDVQLVVPDGLLIRGQERMLQRNPVWRLYRVVARQLLGSPDTVIFPSVFLRDFYQRYGFFQKSQSVVIKNPTPVVSHGGVRSSSDPEMVRFLFVGQLEPAKGVEWLVNVFMTSADPSWRLTIVGDGSLHHALRPMTLDDPRIELRGRVVHDELGNVYAEHDYVIVPPLCYENDPMVVVEAFSYAVPVIAAQIGGAAERIEEGVNGFVFAAGDEASLMNALNGAAIMRQMHHWQQMSDNARECVRGQGVAEYVRALLALGIAR